MGESIILSAKTTGIPKTKSQTGKTMAVNRAAYRNYEIVETFEAGISLKGTEGS
jgi:SmpB protein